MKRYSVLRVDNFPYSVFAKCRSFLLRVLVCTVHAENAGKEPIISGNAL